MTDSYSKRKYAGPTQQEKRKTEPKQNRKKSRRKKREHQADLFRIVTSMKSDIETERDHCFWWGLYLCIPAYKDGDACPAVSISTSVLNDYTYKVKKYMVFENKKTKVCWIEDQRKNLVSPEFSCRRSMVDWLLYKALEDKFAYVERREIKRRWSRETKDWIDYNPPKLKYYFNQVKQDFYKLGSTW